MKRFFITYMGAKYQESPKLERYDFRGYKTVVEPFGGTYGFSRWLYSDQDMTDTRYVVYDIDAALIAFYKALQADAVGVLAGYHALKSEVEAACADTPERKAKYKHRNLLVKPVAMRFIEDAEHYPEAVRWMVKHELEVSIFPVLNAKKPDPAFVAMLDRVEFHEEAFTHDMIERYDASTTLWYLDPPYLMECNTKYTHKGNQFTLFATIRKLLNDAGHSAILVHCANELLEAYLGPSAYSYDKTYGSSKKIMHSVWVNGCPLSI